MSRVSCRGLWRWVVCLALIGTTQAISAWPNGGGDATNNLKPQVLQDNTGPYTINLTGYGDKTGINFMGTKYTELQVSTNGVVEFGTGGGASSMPRQDPTLPVGDPSYGPYIAAFWEHAKAPNLDSGEVRIFISDDVIDSGDAIGLRKETTTNHMTSLMKNYFHNIAQDYNTTSLAILVTWSGIYSEGHSIDQSNYHQLAILTDGCQTYIMVNYVTMEWTASATDSGNKPRAAVSSGNGIDFFNMPDSDTATIFRLAENSNVHDVARANGWFWLRVDRAAVMELCPAACETQNFGTCERYGCTCNLDISQSIDCTDTIYSDMCWTEPRGECPTPCGGCSSIATDSFCDQCAGVLSTSVEDCNVKECEKGIHATTEIVYKGGRRIKRNRKCCYQFSKNPPVKYSVTRFPVGKSCCRPRVKGWSGTPPLPAC